MARCPEVPKKEEQLRGSEEACGFGISLRKVWFSWNDETKSWKTLPHSVDI